MSTVAVLPRGINSTDAESYAAKLEHHRAWRAENPLPVYKDDSPYDPLFEPWDMPSISEVAEWVFPAPPNRLTDDGWKSPPQNPKRVPFKISPERHDRRKWLKEHEWMPRNPTEKARFEAVGMTIDDGKHPLVSTRWDNAIPALRVLAWHRGLWLIEVGERDKCEGDRVKWGARILNDLTKLVNGRYGDSFHAATRPPELTDKVIVDIACVAAEKSWDARNPRDYQESRSKSLEVRQTKAGKRRAEIMELVQQGVSTSKIAKTLGVTDRTVRRTKAGGHL